MCFFQACAPQKPYGPTCLETTTDASFKLALPRNRVDLELGSETDESLGVETNDSSFPFAFPSGVRTYAAL